MAVLGLELFLLLSETRSAKLNAVCALSLVSWTSGLDVFLVQVDGGIWTQRRRQSGKKICLIRKGLS